jgi:hypothetical protein
MMSIESIQMEAVAETGSVFIDQNKIEEDYEKLIHTFDTKYKESPLCSDHNAVAPGV